MRKTKILTGFLLILTFAFTVYPQRRTEIDNARAAQTLLGRHRLSLQWISWDHFGAANVTRRDGVFYLKGRQDGRGASRGDYLTVEGFITSIGAREFSFDGKSSLASATSTAARPASARAK